ncbi:MAG: lipid-binding SYLF domain-containing protein [Desulfobulbus sp.]|jgi:lipid-binding SYLF domain-containing protein|uniref:lipid-binding SYLF domain-containing protein n=1 Tax=Desulfobulbus sp. TaxID=895 RepID=UPI0028515FC4|nr:lipid-binding SYLF domain-containing protein [Desulfobulbus sp.]MDR2550904.1 lipid-binding SYLF domain-containing protein [Desulfobulbus sp.]
MMRSHRLFLIAMVAILATVLFRVPAKADYYGEPAELVDRATSVYKGFLADPNLEWFRNNVGSARGILIVPQMLRGGFIIGGSGGRGLLVAQDAATNKWSSPAFYSMGSVSVGFQIGADVSEIILLIMTDRGLDAMLSTDYKIGADVAIAAGPIGGSAKAQTADILAFGRSQGAYGGVSLEGAAISPLVDWNARYYGQPVQIFDILINQKWNNRQADSLRQLLPKPRRNAQPLGR